MLAQAHIVAPAAGAADLAGAALHAAHVLVTRRRARVQKKVLPFKIDILKLSQGFSSRAAVPDWFKV